MANLKIKLVKSLVGRKDRPDCYRYSPLGLSKIGIRSYPA